VLHILAKDVRGLRWLLVVWAVLLGAAVVQAFWVTAPGSMALSFPLQGLPSPMVAGFVAMSAVMGDPIAPGRSRWMTLPVAPRVVAASKLLLFAILLAVTLLVQAWVYAGHGLPWGDVVAQTGFALTTMLPFLVVLPVLGTLVSERHWPAVVYLIPLLVTQAIGGLLDERTLTELLFPPVTGVPSWLRAVLPVVATVPLLFAMYRRGGITTPLRLAALGALLLIPFAPRANEPPRFLAAQLPAAGAPAVPERTGGEAVLVGDSLGVWFPLASVRGTTTTVTPTRLVARLAGGDSLVFADTVAWPAYERIVTRAMPAAPAGAIAGDTTRVVRPHWATIRLDAATRTRLATSLVAVELQGIERRYTSVPALELPLADRTPRAAQWRRFRITDAPPAGDTLVTVAASSLAPESDDGETTNIAYALDVPSRGAFVPLASAEPDYMGAPIIFMGEQQWAYRARLLAPAAASARTLLDAPDARLVVFRNEPAGARRVVLTLPARTAAVARAERP
jgi:hypothetical protein